MPGERMTLARIAVDSRVGFSCEGCFDLGLRLLRDKLVLLAEMHEQWGLQSVNFGEVFLRIGAMISNGGVDFVAGGRYKDHQGTKTKSKQSNFSTRFFKLNGSTNRFHDVPHTRVAIKRRIKSETVLPAFFRRYVEINSRLLPPEQVRCDRDKPLGRQLIAGRSNVGGNTKQLLKNDHCRRGY